MELLADRGYDFGVSLDEDDRLLYVVTVTSSLAVDGALTTESLSTADEKYRGLLLTE